MDTSNYYRKQVFKYYTIHINGHLEVIVCITCGLSTKLFPAEQLSDEEEEDMSELVGDGGKEFVPPLLPTLPLFENWR